MKAMICDFCKTAIDQDSTPYVMRIDDRGPIDMCLTCYDSPVIISELRRTRTRTRKAKIGRPKGSKSRKETQPMVVDETVKELLEGG